VPELLVVATTAALDATGLVEALRAQLPAGAAVRSAPGLLAEGEPGEGLVRDGARARGAVVLVLAPGGPDLANHAGLTVAVSREAGLPVPAVVVAGPGGGAQLEVLRAHAMTEVVELADPVSPADAVATWPVAAWLAAEPAVATAVGVALTPYGGWTPHPTPDPRTAGRDAVDAALLEVVAAEGPILASRAFGLVNRAGGGKKLTSIVLAPLTSSASRLRHHGRLEITPAGEVPGLREDVLRLAGTPPVRVRELGPRTLDEVPLDELAELMRRLRVAGAAELRRTTLDAYGLVRMTAHAGALLAEAEALLGADGALE
jgi:hypothetical protein